MSFLLLKVVGVHPNQYCQRPINLLEVPYFVMMKYVLLLCAFTRKIPVGSSNNILLKSWFFRRNDILVSIVFWLILCNLSEKISTKNYTLKLFDNHLQILNYNRKLQKLCFFKTVLSNTIYLHTRQL